jgi:hypothetical protein
MPSLQQIFKDAFLQSLSGLSRERYKKFCDMNLNPKEPKSELSQLSSLLKT